MSFSESSSTTAMRPDGTATMLSELAPTYYIIKLILARVLSDTSMWAALYTTASKHDAQAVADLHRDALENALSKVLSL